MKNIQKKDRDNLIKLLQEKKDIPEKYQDILFPDEQTQKEYELTYAGKEREEDIIADTLAAPLQDVRTFNSDNKFDDNWTNKLIFGDNLMALKSLYEDPNIKGKVKLIYIDPPFATKKDFMKDEEKAYRDKVVGSKFLEFARKRLILLREILAEDGSIYVHLDQKKGHYIKVLLDEIFIESNFQNEIAWHYKSFHGQVSRYFPRKHDNIFFYKKSTNASFELKRNADVEIEDLIDFKNWGKYIVNENEIRGDFMPTDVRFKRWLVKWQKANPDKKPTKNDVIFIFRSQPYDDVWDINYIDPKDTKEKVNYPTQKPEKLLERIIEASSKEGDIVLDAFAGSGTTLAVAEKLKRRWIGMDCGKLAIYTIQKRILGLRSEIGNTGDSYKSKAFTLYNAGLYDWMEIKKLDFVHYRDFVLKLFQVRDEVHTVRGIEIDGYVGDDNAYLWNHTKEKKSKLDLSFIKSLHAALSGNGGEIFYVIAPASAFAFYEDEIKLNDTIYKTLRVPQSVITELIKRGGDTIKQPTNEQDVNDTIDAVGFDFIQVPEVEAEYKVSKANECVIKIKTFKSRTLTKSPEEFENYETLSMVMVDYNYDGKIFDLDAVFYADSIKPDYEVRFDSKNVSKQLMIIYLDVYGNEKKEILSMNDFRK